MSRLLDVPWVVNEEAERISTHGGLATVDFNGTEKERREAMRLVAQAPKMARLLRDFLKNYEMGQHVDVQIESVLRDAGMIP